MRAWTRRLACLALVLPLGACTLGAIPASWAIAGLSASGISYMGFRQGSEAKRIRRIADEKYSPRPPEYPIHVTGGDLANPYRELAVVTTRAYDERVIEVAGMADLRTIACELGGDAVVRVVHNGVVAEEFGYDPGSLTRWGTRFDPRYTLTGVVVRYER